MTYKPKYFKLYELLPKKIYDTIDHNIAWWIFDDRALRTLDVLRLYFGTTIINTWKWGGKNHYRGYRPDDCPVGAKYSQHKFGRAFDCIFPYKNTAKVRLYILEHPQIFPHISSIEMETPHLHFDIRNSRTENDIRRFYP